MPPRLNTVLILLSLLTVIALLLSCGGHKLSSAPVNGVIIPTGNAAAQPSVSIQDALAGLARMSAPAGVDAAVFAQVKDALRAALVARGEKAASDAPEGPANSVPDLTVTDNGDTTATLSWHYYNLGDYNQDGVVGIADITPIVMHYGEAVPPGDPNSLLAVIDGSGNGVVDVGDVTAIAAHFNTNLHHYSIRQIEYMASNDYIIAGIGLTDACAIESGRLAFSYDVSLHPGYSYIVTPYDAAGAYGISSNFSGPLPLCEEWEHRWDDAYHSDVKAVVTGNDGSIYTFGHVQLTNDASSEHDVLAVKYSAGGEVQWQKTWDFTSVGGPTAAAVGADGNVYALVAGAIIVKCTPDGDVVWQRLLNLTDYAGIGFYDSTGLAICADGSIYVCATAWTSSLFYRLATIKLMPDGTLAWARRWAGAREEYAESIAVDDTGHIYVAGHVYDDPTGERNLILLAYDEEGSLLWSSLWNTNSGTGKAVLTIDADGYLWVAGGNSPFFMVLRQDGFAYDCRALDDGRIHEPLRFARGGGGNIYLMTNNYPPGYHGEYDTDLFKFSGFGAFEWILRSSSMYRTSDHGTLAFTADCDDHPIRVTDGQEIFGQWKLPSGSIPPGLFAPTYFEVTYSYGTSDTANATIEDYPIAVADVPYSDSETLANTTTCLSRLSPYYLECAIGQ